MTQLDTVAKDAITRARSALLIDEPFFGTLAMRLKLAENSAMPTLAVDGQNMFYNPTFIKSLPINLLKSAIGHEVLHCALEHCGNGRNMGKEPQRWNHAADYAVNALLKKAGFELGQEWLYSPNYENLTAEEIYNMLPPNTGSGGSGGNQPGPLDQVLPGPANQDPSVTQQQQTEWKIATRQAAAAAKAVGKMSQAIEQFIDEALKPKVRWQDELRQYMDTIAKDDYAWQRPNRKMLAAGFVLPGLYSEGTGMIDIGNDESGSITAKELAVFAREIKGIFEDVHPEKVRVFHFASECTEPEVFENLEDFKLVQRITGGTDFGPVFEQIEASGEYPKALVMLSDMYGTFPDKAPDYPVIWCATSKIVAPFGHTIHIDLHED